MSTFFYFVFVHSTFHPLDNPEFVIVSSERDPLINFLA